ncbi:MAG: tRNA 2-thiouridine(34) synthase MnmA [Planctomycetes bacterium]|nr:tRNA 2-thiouridine(34) synthase MnmA [Planctomycetota bacterium]
MSGGVDSSVAAALLKDEGYDIVGVFMRNGAIAEPEDDACDLKPNAEPPSGGEGRDRVRPHKQGCCSVNDAHDARLVAAMLDIPFYVLNFEKDFERIQRYFVAEYNAGRTPNPCVRCNDWLKFGKLHAYARSIDADFVATGHYARVVHDGDATPTPSRGRSAAKPRIRLLRGLDHSKDQSYVLFGSRLAQLRHMLLPIGGYHKNDIRAMAEELKLPTFNKPDSQEICFVPDNDYASFVERRTDGGFAPGNIVDTTGNVIGEHAGHQRFTHGQRRGVGVALGYPIYVVEKDPATNTITIGGKDDLRSDACRASQCNWLIDPRKLEPRPRNGLDLQTDADGWIECQAKVRYNSQPVAAQVRAVWGDAPKPNAEPPSGGEASDQRDHPDLEVQFDQPQEAVTPGQAVVCYGPPDSDWQDTVLCGGWIDEAY